MVKILPMCKQSLKIYKYIYIYIKRRIEFKPLRLTQTDFKAEMRQQLEEKSPFLFVR